MPEHVDTKIADESSLIIPSSPVEEEEEEEFLEVEGLDLIQQDSIAPPPMTTTVIDEPTTSTTTTNGNNTEDVDGAVSKNNQTKEVDTTDDADKVEELVRELEQVHPTTSTTESEDSKLIEQIDTTPSTTTTSTISNSVATTSAENQHVMDPSSPNALLEELDHIFDTPLLTLPQHQQQPLIHQPIFTQSCSSSSLTIPLKDFSLNYCSKVNNFQRRKRKDHPSPTLYEQQIKQHTKRTKTNPIYQNIPINFVSNSAFLLSNVIESSVPYNNTTVCYDDHSTHQCPWLDLLSTGNREELVLDESSVLLGKLQKLSLLQNTSSSSLIVTNNSRYSLVTDPYCTIMRIGGRIYRETYEDHSSCTFNALINCGNDNKFLMLQLQNNALNDNIFTVYARFGQVGNTGQTYSRLFDNIAHAKQFFVDSLLAITGSATVSSQCSIASRVCYDIPSISFF